MLFTVFSLLAASKAETVEITVYQWYSEQYRQQHPDTFGCSTEEAKNCVEGCKECSQNGLYLDRTSCPNYCGWSTCKSYRACLADFSSDNCGASGQVPADDHYSFRFEGSCRVWENLHLTGNSTLDDTDISYGVNGQEDADNMISKCVPSTDWCHLNEAASDSDCAVRFSCKAAKPSVDSVLPYVTFILVILLTIFEIAKFTGCCSKGSRANDKKVPMTVAHDRCSQGKKQWKSTDTIDMSGF